MVNVIRFVLVVLGFSLSQGKVFDRCELARQVQSANLPKVSTWICIAKHESGYDTTKINSNTGDHGIFQISQLYWCSDSNVPGKACQATCSQFRNDDISDDIACVRKIYDEHQRLSGNGFNAWTVYPKYCAGDTSSYTQGCF